VGRLDGKTAVRSAERMKPLLARIQPIPRSGLPEDIARAALWLASDESSFVSGHALVVDSGMIGGTGWPASEKPAMRMAETLGVLP
jgi:NAD(P)-dependent dehydrogenase (short-subunit alcohol dehydrogenase family)